MRDSDIVSQRLWAISAVAQMPRGRVVEDHWDAKAVAWQTAISNSPRPNAVKLRDCDNSLKTQDKPMIGS